MSVDKGDTRRRPWPSRPERPWERNWPTPTPGVPRPKSREENRMLKQILDKLVDIEKRLESIEKHLSGRSGKPGRRMRG